MTMVSDERRDIAEGLRYMSQYERICYKEQFFDELAETVVGFEEFPWPCCPNCGARVVRGDEG